MKERIGDWGMVRHRKYKHKYVCHGYGTSPTPPPCNTYVYNLSSNFKLGFIGNKATTGQMDFDY